MNFPEVTGWLANVEALVRVIGVGMFLIGLGVAAISLISAGIFHNETREIHGKSILILCGVGLFFVLTAPVWQKVVAQIAGVALP